MFTPYRELTIVHAVRQPLDAPWANILAPFRTAGRNLRLPERGRAGRPQEHAAGRRALGATWTPTTTE